MDGWIRSFLDPIQVLPICLYLSVRFGAGLDDFGDDLCLLADTYLVDER